jgi:hypothetical protein
MNFPAISHDDLPAASSGKPRRARPARIPATETDPEDDLVRQLAERARMQRLKHELQRMRREPALSGRYM